MFSPDVHAALATQRHADLLAQGRRVRLARLARTARPGSTRGATSGGRTRRRPMYGDVRGLVDELRGYWDRRAAGQPPIAA